MSPDPPTTVGDLRLFSPAKVNLLLCVHGRREDGFHDLTSLMVPINFGDWLEVGFAQGRTDRLACDCAEIPNGSENLILRAAAAFRRRTNTQRYFRFRLDKRIPVGAGLGGGSGNAAVALVAMNRLCEAPLGEEELIEVAALVGSDCPFFVRGEPAVVRGRGERLTPVGSALAARLRELRLLVFHPGFAVGTAWAYGRLATSPTAYVDTRFANDKLSAFARGDALERCLFNAFETPVGEKFLAIPTLLASLRQIGAAAAMSGSGSACFVITEQADEAARSNCRKLIDEGWGGASFCIEIDFYGRDKDSPEDASASI